VGHKRKEVPGAVNVVTNSAQVGHMGADHLIQCGFKHFAFVEVGRGPQEPISWSRVRQEHFAERVRMAGYSTQSYLLYSATKRDWKRERAALIAWLKALPKPVGLMACNDDCGVQVMEACKTARIAVPDAIGVIGADNDEVVCGLSNPAMSSVAINFERAGFEAAEALDELMKGKRQTGARINVGATHIVGRRSTDVVAVSDAQLGRALRFIRDHSHRAIGVADVALAAGLSRRALERRFRSQIGNSILDQIRKARTAQICRMLVETDLPVGRIAEALGFEDIQHFARYFRSGRDMSPLAYRRTFGKQTRRGTIQPTVDQNLSLPEGPVVPGEGIVLPSRFTGQKN